MSAIPRPDNFMQGDLGSAVVDGAPPRGSPLAGRDLTHGFSSIIVLVTSVRRNPSLNRSSNPYSSETRDSRRRTPVRQYTTYRSAAARTSCSVLMRANPSCACDRVRRRGRPFRRARTARCRSRYSVAVVRRRSCSAAVIWGPTRKLLGNHDARKDLTSSPAWYCPGFDQSNSDLIVRPTRSRTSHSETFLGAWQTIKMVSSWSAIQSSPFLSLTFR